MLEKIESPENVIAFKAVGKIDSADYKDVLTPAVEAMIKAQNEVRIVYQIADDFTGYTAGATWVDAKLGMSHVSKWKKVAIVSDHGWVPHVVGMFGWMIPGEVEHFSNDKLDDAIKWAAD
jgi:hypothetical protein